MKRRASWWKGAQAVKKKSNVNERRVRRNHSEQDERKENKMNKMSQTEEKCKRTNLNQDKKKRVIKEIKDTKT